ncbi:MAG: zf-HC2 domain-containing protein [Candidatus Bruticola sp.]
MGFVELSETAPMNRLDCQECTDKLLDYEDGLLSSADAAKVRTHLEECAECSRYQHALREGWKNLGLVFPQDIEPDPNFKIRFWKTVGQEANSVKLIDLQQELKKKNKRLRYWSSLAAVASFVLIGGAVLWNVAFNSSNLSPAEQSQANWRYSASVSSEVNGPAKLVPALYRVGSRSVSNEAEPYYTEYVVADEFSADMQDSSDSFTYADYDQDYGMSQELLDMAFNEAAGVQN